MTTSHFNVSIFGHFCAKWFQPSSVVVQSKCLLRAAIDFLLHVCGYHRYKVKLKFTVNQPGKALSFVGKDMSITFSISRHQSRKLSSQRAGAFSRNGFNTSVTFAVRKGQRSTNILSFASLNSKYRCVQNSTSREKCDYGVLHFFQHSPRQQCILLTRFCDSRHAFRKNLQFWKRPCASISWFCEKMSFAILCSVILLALLQNTQMRDLKLFSNLCSITRINLRNTLTRLFRRTIFWEAMLLASKNLSLIFWCCLAFVLQSVIEGETSAGMAFTLQPENASPCNSLSWVVTILQNAPLSSNTFTNNYLCFQ